MGGISSGLQRPLRREVPRWSVGPTTAPAQATPRIAPCVGSELGLIPRAQSGARCVHSLRARGPSLHTSIMSSCPQTAALLLQTRISAKNSGNRSAEFGRICRRCMSSQIQRSRTWADGWSMRTSVATSQAIRKVEHHIVRCTFGPNLKPRRSGPLCGGPVGWVAKGSRRHACSTW